MSWPIEYDDQILNNITDAFNSKAPMLGSICPDAGELDSTDLVEEGSHLPFIDQRRQSSRSSLNTPILDLDQLWQQVSEGYGNFEDSTCETCKYPQPHIEAQLPSKSEKTKLAGNNRFTLDEEASSVNYFTAPVLSTLEQQNSFFNNTGTLQDTGSAANGYFQFIAQPGVTLETGESSAQNNSSNDSLYDEITEIQDEPNSLDTHTQAIPNAIITIDRNYLPSQNLPVSSAITQSAVAMDDAALSTQIHASDDNYDNDIIEVYQPVLPSNSGTSTSILPNRSCKRSPSTVSSNGSACYDERAASFMGVSRAKRGRRPINNHITLEEPRKYERRDDDAKSDPRYVATREANNEAVRRSRKKKKLEQEQQEAEMQALREQNRDLQTKLAVQIAENKMLRQQLEEYRSGNQ